MDANDQSALRAPGAPTAHRPLTDADMAQAGELYEDVNDLFRLARRAAMLVVQHRLNLRPLDAERIVEAWWFGCRKKF